MVLNIQYVFNIICNNVYYPNPLVDSPLKCTDKLIIKDYSLY